MITMLGKTTGQYDDTTIKTQSLRNCHTYQLYDLQGEKAYSHAAL
jgi:hypothetical protein